MSSSLGVSAPIARLRDRSSALSLATFATYSVPLLGPAVMWHMVGFYFLKYSTDTLSMEPAVVGAIFGAARVWDAISDPLAGYASDRTRTRIGRRRPWILAAALPLPLCFAAMWWPVELTDGARIVWVTVASFLFYTALTVFRIPHLSLAAELTRDVAARTRLFAASGGADVGGGLIGIGILVLVASGDSADVEAMTWVIAGVAAATVPLLLWCGAGLREPSVDRSCGGRGPYAAFGDVWRNPDARVLLVVSFLPTLGLVCASTCAPYLADYVLGDASVLVGVLLAFAIGNLCALPLCAPISQRFGMRTTWLFSRVLQAVAMAGYFAVPHIGLVPLVIISVFAGFMDGLGGVVMRSLQARVIDWDADRTGERREGTYFAFWNLASKTALGVGVFAVGTTLQLAGFESGADQSGSSLLAIRLLMSAAPCLCLLSAALVFQRSSLPE